MLWFQQFRAVVRKNWLLKKRKPWSTLFEILLPFLVMCVLVAIHSAIDQEWNEESLRLQDRIEFRVDTGVREIADQLDILDAKLAIVPESHPLLQEFNQTLALEYPELANRTVGFASRGALRRYVDDTRYGFDPRFPRMLFALELNEASDPVIAYYDYTIRGNATVSKRPAKATLPMTNLIPYVDTLTKRFEPRWLEMFVNDGVVTLQYLMDRFLTAKHAPQAPLDQAELAFVPFPTAGYIDDVFADLVEQLLGLMLCLVFLWPVTRLIRNLVEEKELRIKEGMAMMGLPSSVVWTSWMFTYLVMMAITAALIALVTAGNIYKYSDPVCIWLLYFLFGCAVFAFSLLVSVFFAKATTASVLGSVLFLASYLIGYGSLGADTDPGTKDLASLSLTLAFSQGATLITKMESSQQGVNWDNWGTSVENYTFGQAIAFLFADTLIYLLLALYLEQVLPREFGVRK